MKIRSITCFYTPEAPDSDSQLTRLAKFSQSLREALQLEGIEVQSLRMATPPFITYSAGKSEQTVVQLMQKLEAQAKEKGFTYLSCGPALPDDLDSFRRIPALLAGTKDVFVTGIIADQKQFYPAAIEAAADVICQAATITPDGFTNLRFSALCNVQPGAPFFPTAYHSYGQAPAFALAIECADEVIRAFKGQTSLSESRQRMLDGLNGFAQKIGEIIQKVNTTNPLQFLGFDFSPAPYPDDTCSLGGGVEAVFSGTLGPVGSLAAAAVIADTLDQGNWLHAGFNGLMLPVLEDSILAARAAEGKLSVKDLLLFSAVCGTGLDTVPLAGDVSREEISALLFDIAALSVRLGKPLTARLMPIPGKQAATPQISISAFSPTAASCL
jgi:uncharacterized protein (UPF0210 family)